MLAAEGGATRINEVLDISPLLGEIAAEVRWDDGTATPVNINAGADSGPLRIQFDYSRDRSSLFDSQQTRNTLELAGRLVMRSINDRLSAIVPNPGQQRNWVATFPDPSTGQPAEVPNLRVNADTLVVYVGGRDWTGSTIARGGFGGFSIPETGPFPNQGQLDAWLAFAQDVQSRDQSGVTGNNPTDFATWGGSISFDVSNRAWYFGTDVDGLRSNQTDFLSTAMHELFHVLGFGLTGSWNRLTTNSGFSGANSRREYAELGGSGNVPLDGTQHWATPLVGSRGNISSMEERIFLGDRQLPTPLDFAGLDDMGWEIDTRSVRVDATHVYGDDGQYNPVVVLTGSLGGELRTTFPTTITNAPPTVSGPAAFSVVAGVATPELTWTTTDPSFTPAGGTTTADAITYRIQWDDGTEDSGDAVAVSAGSPTSPSTTRFVAGHVFEQPGTYTVSATVDDGDGGQATATTIVTVTEPPELNLSLSRSVVDEDDGADASILSVSRSGSTTAAVTVTLVSSDRSIARVAGSVTIPAGQRSASTPVDVVDNRILDGTRMVSFTASAAGVQTGDVTLNVNDVETFVANFQQVDYAETAGTNTIRLIVLRENLNRGEAVSVRVAGGDGRVTYDSEAIIGAGNATAVIRMTPVANTTREPTQRLTFTITGDGYVPASASFFMLDDDNGFQNVGDRFNVGQGVNPSDVTVTALDALQIINALNAENGEFDLRDRLYSAGTPFWDVNGDLRVSAVDALQVINRLNDQANANASGERVSLVQRGSGEPVTSGVLSTAGRVARHSVERAFDDDEKVRRIDDALREPASDGRLF